MMTTRSIAGGIKGSGEHMSSESEAAPWLKDLSGRGAVLAWSTTTSSRLSLTPRLALITALWEVEVKAIHSDLPLHLVFVDHLDNDVVATTRTYPSSVVVVVDAYAISDEVPEIRLTLLHELAHVAVGTHAGHNDAWCAAVTRIGGTDEVTRPSPVVVVNGRRRTVDI